MTKNKPLFEEREIETFDKITLVSEIDADKQVKTLKKYLNKKNRIVDKTNQLLSEIENETLHQTRK